MGQTPPILIVTRPEAAGAAFAAKVSAAVETPVETILSPLIEIEHSDAARPDRTPDAVILTSANAVPAARSMGLPPGCVAWCVGPRTAADAADAGLEVRHAGGDADAIVEMILAHRPNGRLLHLRGAVSRGDVANRLRAAGIACDEAIVYRQRLRPLSQTAMAAMAGKRPIVLPLFSPRTAASLAGHGPFAAPIHAIAMSAAVAAAIRPAGTTEIEVVEQPDEPRMLTRTLDVIRRLATGEA